MEQNLEIFCEAFLRLRAAKTPIVVVTLTGERGHAPQDLGARMIAGSEGILFGTIGGGKIEKKCLDLCRELLASGTMPVRHSVHWNLKRDVGMSCGGEVSFLFEMFHPGREWRIALFGAGHIVQELAPLLLKLDCKLLVCDPRPEWISKLPENPRLEKRICSDMVEVLKTISADSFVAMITMGHSTDYPLLVEALRSRDFPYLAVLGSRVKRIKMDADLRDAGFPVEKIRSYRCPIGEDYGKNTPAEIAISIAADLLRARRDLGITGAGTRPGGGSSLHPESPEP
jgi:xanthine dehydrogenase accessory factor